MPCEGGEESGKGPQPTHWGRCVQPVPQRRRVAGRRLAGTRARGSGSWLWAATPAWRRKVHPQAGGRGWEGGGWLRAPPVARCESGDGRACTAEGGSGWCGGGRGGGGASVRGVRREGVSKAGRGGGKNGGDRPYGPCRRRRLASACWGGGLGEGEGGGAGAVREDGRGGRLEGARQHGGREPRAMRGRERGV